MPSSHPARRRRKPHPPSHPCPPSSAPLAYADFLPPAGDWQYVHDIGFSLAKGGGGSALGVVVLAKGEIRCALTTVEGLTLFEARTKPARPRQVKRCRSHVPCRPVLKEHGPQGKSGWICPACRAKTQGNGGYDD